jgi:hypothetical protein
METLNNNTKNSYFVAQGVEEHTNVHVTGEDLIAAVSSKKEWKEYLAKQGVTFPKEGRPRPETLAARAERNRAFSTRLASFLEQDRISPGSGVLGPRHTVPEVWPPQTPYPWVVGGMLVQVMPDLPIDVPPAPPLVGIETNPGPPKSAKDDRGKQKTPLRVIEAEEKARTKHADGNACKESQAKTEKRPKSGGDHKAGTSGAQKILKDQLVDATARLAGNADAKEELKKQAKEEAEALEKQIIDEIKESEDLVPEAHQAVKITWRVCTDPGPQKDSVVGHVVSAPCTACAKHFVAWCETTRDIYNVQTGLRVNHARKPQFNLDGNKYDDLRRGTGCWLEFTNERPAPYGKGTQATITAVSTAVALYPLRNIIPLKYKALTVGLSGAYAYSKHTPWDPMVLFPPMPEKVEAFCENATNALGLLTRAVFTKSTGRWLGEDEQDVWINEFNRVRDYTCTGLGYARAGVEAALSIMYPPLYVDPDGYSERYAGIIDAESIVQVCRDGLAKSQSLTWYTDLIIRHAKKPGVCDALKQVTQQKVVFGEGTDNCLIKPFLGSMASKDARSRLRIVASFRSIAAIDQMADRIVSRLKGDG